MLYESFVTSWGFRQLATPRLRLTLLELATHRVVMLYESHRATALLSEHSDDRGKDALQVTFVCHFSLCVRFRWPIQLAAKSARITL